MPSSPRPLPSGRDNPVGGRPRRPRDCSERRRRARTTASRSYAERRRRRPAPGNPGIFRRKASSHPYARLAPRSRTRSAARHRPLASQRRTFRAPRRALSSTGHRCVATAVRSGTTASLSHRDGSIGTGGKHERPPAREPQPPRSGARGPCSTSSPRARRPPRHDAPRPVVFWTARPSLRPQFDRPSAATTDSAARRPAASARTVRVMRAGGAARRCGRSAPRLLLNLRR